MSVSNAQLTDGTCAFYCYRWCYPGHRFRPAAPLTKGSTQDLNSPGTTRRRGGAGGVRGQQLASNRGMCYRNHHRHRRLPPPLFLPTQAGVPTSMTSVSLPSFEMTRSTPNNWKHLSRLSPSPRLVPVVGTHLNRWPNETTAAATARCTRDHIYPTCDA